MIVLSLFHKRLVFVGELRWVNKDWSNDDQVEPVEVTAGEDAIMKCLVYGEKVISLTWYIDDVKSEETSFGKDKVPDLAQILFVYITVLCIYSLNV